MKIAIVGGGQLARMLALAGMRLGMQFSFLLDSKDREDTRCIDGLGNQVPFESDSDWATLFEALDRPDLITVEKEQIDVAVLKGLSRYCPVYPSPDAFETCSYRQRQKRLLQGHKIPVASYVYLEQSGDRPVGIESLQYPLFAKSTHNAYDGRNQFILHSPEDLKAFQQRGLPGGWIVEESVAFRKEVSIIAARSVNGEMAFYPPTENHHRQGVLVYSVSPAPDLEPVEQQTLMDTAQSILEGMDYVGVLAIECFLTKSDVLVNEIAPRVHNSGHWTSSGAITCQFENHLRAVAGLPLGATDSIGSTAMVNLLGVEAPPLQLLNSRSSLHWYNKSSRPGRKVGHINLQNHSLDELKNDVMQLVNKVDTMTAQDVEDRRTA